MAPPPAFAPCRYLLPSLRTVVLETQYTHLYQQPVPPHLLLSLFTPPRSISRLELNGSTLHHMKDMPAAASTAARDVKELRVDWDLFETGEVSHLVKSFPNLATLEIQVRIPLSMGGIMADSDY